MDDTKKLAQFMIKNGIVTGHGDNVDDLLNAFQVWFDEGVKSLRELQAVNQTGAEDEKILAQELREENDRLSFKMKCNAIRGKTFTFEEAQQLHIDREKELASLTAPNSQPVSAALEEAQDWLADRAEELMQYDGELEDVDERCIQVIRQALAQAGGQWQNISTAPKDGLILVCWENSGVYPIVSRWLENAQQWSTPFNKPTNPPTHWQYIPDAIGNVKCEALAQNRKAPVSAKVGE